MASSSSAEQADNSVKKRSKFFLFKKKNSKQNGGNDQSQKNTDSSVTGNTSAAKEFEDRAKADQKAFSMASRESKRSLVALAYETKTKKNNQKSIKNSNKAIGSSVSGNKESVDASPSTGGWFSSRFTGSSFFRKLCNDVFDSIDVDGSGKIDESELYQGLLLIHLKLGMYFGPAACKPISLDRTKFIFNKLDTNRDGSLCKDEFQSVLALLMGNVMSRIMFQFACTLLIVPFIAHTILENGVDAYVFVHGVVTESWLPVFREQYQPLLEMALGWDIISRYTAIVISTVTGALRESGLTDRLFDLVEGPMEFVAEKCDAFILKPISEIPQETLDSLPLTLVSTILTIIIVPYSILKTDDFFRFLANRSGGAKRSSA